MSATPSPLVHRPQAPRRSLPRNPERAVFLDRDGTLIEDTHYLTRIADLRILEGAAEAVRALSGEQFVIVVTNQSALARGLLEESVLDELHRTLLEQLAAEEARIDAIYTCPHLEDGVNAFRTSCQCRKPKPGLLLQAAQDFGLRLGACALLGDSDRDLAAARGAGVRAIAVPKNRPNGLLEAVRCLS